MDVWRQETERLRKRLRNLVQEAPADRNESGSEAEGLRSRFRALHKLIAEAAVLEGSPDTWRRETETVRLGSRITLELQEGEREMLMASDARANPVYDYARPRSLSSGFPVAGKIIVYSFSPVTLS